MFYTVYTLVVQDICKRQRRNREILLDAQTGILRTIRVAEIEVSQNNSLVGLSVQIPLNNKSNSHANMLIQQSN
jgi:hypothetical protein